MKIIGKNSLLYWLRIPFTIYTIGFLVMSLWIFILMSIFSFSNATNHFISKSSWNVPNNNEQSNTEIIQFHYPFTKMVLSTENTPEGILMSFIGLFSFCFILFFALKLVFKLSENIIFSSESTNHLKFFGIGLIVIGMLFLIVDLTNGFTLRYNSYDLTPSFFYILVGFIILFIKEIFVKGKNLQEENELTI